ncbi:PREDICTED: E3 ubiquitin-protein ligase LNX-like [Branchiostoma belcheri]|uniref:E3 ubiquitin-protein ligase LNX-like n=1 Tax=Branchiostoma belcheri TaxID=7741 RepID=A0A6P5AB62_BRABE|nr:PREDICTED: E3 ubiquitin-protein ligase LNX-like [Branchiostoma belcheri]
MSKKRTRGDDGCMDVNQAEEERYFLNPESVSEHLYCSICQDVFKEPQRAPCGHSYCKQCIMAWLRTSKTCPEDRRPVREKDLHYDFILANIIGDHMVACPFRKLGCEFVGKLELLTSHRKSCCFNPANLPEFLLEEPQPSTSGKAAAAATASSLDTSSSFCTSDDENKLPSPPKPSLKMRLFKNGASQRDLLKNMFDKENRPK